MPVGVLAAAVDAGPVYVVGGSSRPGRRPHPRRPAGHRGLPDLVTRDLPCRPVRHVRRGPRLPGPGRWPDRAVLGPVVRRCRNRDTGKLLQQRLGRACPVVGDHRRRLPGRRPHLAAALELAVRAGADTDTDTAAAIAGALLGPGGAPPPSPRPGVGCCTAGRAWTPATWSGWPHSPPPAAGTTPTDGRPSTA